MKDCKNRLQLGLLTTFFISSEPRNRCETSRALWSTLKYYWTINMHRPFKATLSSVSFHRPCTKNPGKLYIFFEAIRGLFVKLKMRPLRGCPCWGAWGMQGHAQEFQKEGLSRTKFARFSFNRSQNSYKIILPRREWDSAPKHRLLYFTYVRIIGVVLGNKQASRAPILCQQHPDMENNNIYHTSHPLGNVLAETWSVLKIFTENLNLQLGIQRFFRNIKWRLVVQSRFRTSE